MLYIFVPPLLLIDTLLGNLHLHLFLIKYGWEVCMY